MKYTSLDPQLAAHGKSRFTLFEQGRRSMAAADREEGGRGDRALEVFGHRVRPHVWLTGQVGAWGWTMAGPSAPAEGRSILAVHRPQRDGGQCGVRASKRQRSIPRNAGFNGLGWSMADDGDTQLIKAR